MQTCTIQHVHTLYTAFLCVSVSTRKTNKKKTHYFLICWCCGTCGTLEMYRNIFFPLLVYWLDRTLKACKPLFNSPAVLNIQLLYFTHSSPLYLYALLRKVQQKSIESGVRIYIHRSDGDT